MSLSSCGPKALVIYGLLSEPKNLLLLVLLFYVLPSVPGPHGRETRKALFFSVTSLPSLGGLGYLSNGPGSQHVHMRCSAGEWQRPESQENAIWKYPGLFGNQPFSDQGLAAAQAVGQKSLWHSGGQIADADMT